MCVVINGLCKLFSSSTLWCALKRPLECLVTVLSKQWNECILYAKLCSVCALSKVVQLLIWPFKTSFRVLRFQQGNFQIESWANHIRTNRTGCFMEFSNINRTCCWEAWGEFNSRATFSQRQRVLCRKWQLSIYNIAWAAAWFPGYMKSKFLTSEDGTDRLSQNVGKELPVHAA